MDEETFAIYETRYLTAFEQATNIDIDSEDAKPAIENLLKLKNAMPEPPKPAKPEPTTFWAKATRKAEQIMSHDNFGTAIKAVGAFAGVALVAQQTIRHERVFEKQALAQANQTPR